MNLHLIHLKGLNEETQENINVTNTRIEKSVWYLLKQYALLVEIVKLKKGSSALPFFSFSLFVLFYVSFDHLFQISTNAKQILTIATQMPTAITQRDRITASANLDISEMDGVVQVKSRPSETSGFS